MAFIQVFEFETTRPDELQALVDEWEQATEGRRTATKRYMCADRDHPDRYVGVVFFDSYEEAMKNSNLPETKELSGKMMTIVDAPPVFHNLDVIEERE